MRGLYIILLTLLSYAASAQQGFAFTHITTDDGMGLASNQVSSLYQDEKGFIWVGTANGLQRFDGSKFIHFSTRKAGSHELPHTSISQILPGDSGTIILSMATQREFGIFNPSTFVYTPIPLKTASALPPRAEFWLWKNSIGDLYCNVLRYGILKYNKKTHEFIDDYSFKFPENWMPSTVGVHEDVQRQQYWFATDSGLCVYDKPTNTTWSRNYNPHKLPILNNPLLSDRLTQIYVDNQRRFWVFGWPVWGSGAQYKFCFDSTGTRFLHKDTTGLNMAATSYNEYNHFLETRQGDLWIYGLGVLKSYEKTQRRFLSHNSQPQGNNNLSMDYEVIFQVMQDKDGSLWMATDKGLYYTGFGSEGSVTNLVFKTDKEDASFTDVMEMPNGDLWLTSWGTGVRVLDRNLKRVDNAVYANPPPKNWTPDKTNAIRLTWTMCRQSSTGNIWIGCNGGILLVHDPVKKITTYSQPEAANKSTIRYIVEDKVGNIWMGTQGGRLIKWSNGQFTIVKEVGTIIYKVFIDKQGWLWLATHEKGLYAVDAATGNTIQHYTTGSGENKLYSNTGNDVEQLNDSIIVFGGGALNFINKKTGAVRLVKYEDGLPSNTVKRLRMDKRGSLWVITSNGLCRYNPRNNQIITYGRKDGIIIGEQTSSADYITRNNQLVFVGSNAVLLFDADTYSTTTPPPNVTITDFKLYNKFLPVDSLLQFKEIKLVHNENSISIYFASLSFRQRDKLTYFYKMEGIDPDWIKADRSLYVNYSLLPPGHYTFKVYCENIEGIRSEKTTELTIFVKPPFWRTWWFLSTLVFTLALIFYAMHDLRVNRLLAVEKLRNRVARDLHDDMGSTLSTINILSSMAKTKMATDTVKTTEYLSKISDNSQRMMEAMDDIVWSIKPSNDSMQKITARMREFALNVLEAKDIEIDFFIDDPVHDVKLNMEARRDFFLIFKEAINNTAKYSRATKVEAQVTLRQKQIVLIVKDDGIGFDVKAADSGNGLGNMQKRADNMNAKITVQSKVGEGTMVTLVAPVG